MGVEDEDELAIQEKNEASSIEATCRSISDEPADAAKGKAPMYFSMSPGDSSVISANRTVEASVSWPATVSPIARDRSTTDANQGQAPSYLATMSPSPALPTTFEATSYPVPATLEANFDLVADPPAEEVGRSVPLTLYSVRRGQSRSVRGEAWPKEHPRRAVSPTVSSSSSSQPSSDSEDDEPIRPSMALLAADGVGHYPRIPTSSAAEASRVRVSGGSAGKTKGGQAEWVRTWGGGGKAAQDKERLTWPTRAYKEKGEVPKQQQLHRWHAEWARASLPPSPNKVPTRPNPRTNHLRNHHRNPASSSLLPPPSSCPRPPPPARL